MIETFEDRIVLSADVLTYHNDLGRTGANLNETILTPYNVNSTSFGKLFSYNVDGQVYASPLYKSNVFIPGQGTFNVVYIATEHDSVYAFDADSNTSGPSGNGLLWHDSFLGPGIVTFSTADAYGCTQITPEIGITATPVIDPTTNTMYVVAQTKETVPTTTYHQKLHALDIATGAEKFGGPVEITASVPGTGDGGSVVTFNPRDYKERAGLVLVNGVVYTSWASHCDINPSSTDRAHGWVIAYDAATLAQTSIFCTSPNGNLDTIWQGNGSLAVDADGNLYFETGNGSAGPSTGNYDEAFVKLSTSGGLSVADYFIPANYAALDAADQDIGSGAPIALPDQPGAHAHLLVGAGKDGRIFVINRDNMGGLNNPPTGPNLIVQELPNGTVSGGSWDTPAYFDAGSDGNRWIYYAGNNDFLKAFRLSNGMLSTTPSSQSATRFPPQYGATPIVSANGTNDGIVWAIAEGGTAVLHAYDALNLGHELYNSSQAGTRDQLTQGVKFFTPTVADGKVFVATTNSTDTLNTLTIFGLFNQPQDPGFEKPQVGAGAFQYNPTDTPWTFRSSAGVAANGSGFTYANPDAPEGTQVAFLQGNGGAGQMVNFPNTGTYSISFLAAQRAGNYSSQTFQILVDGSAVSTITPPGTAYAPYTSNRFVISATGNHTIAFVGIDPDGQDNTAFIDEVRINHVTAGFGFEAPAIAPGTFQQNPTGGPPAVSYTGTAGIASNGSSLGNPDAPQGTQVGYLQGSGSFSASGMFAAGTYAISFLAAEAMANVGTEEIQVVVDSTVVATLVPTGTSYTAYTTPSFTLTAGMHTISFMGMDSGGSSDLVFLDELQLLH
jgi:hypothetical protein